MKKILEIQNFLATRFVRLVLAGISRWNIQCTCVYCIGSMKGCSGAEGQDKLMRGVDKMAGGHG